MRRVLFAVVLFGCLQAATLAETKKILLVTSKGQFLCEVIDGIPQPWKPQDIEIDIIIHGVVTPDGPKPPIPPDDPPPPTDSTVMQVAALSKTALTSETARAAAALVDALASQGLAGADFVRSLHLAAPIMDAQMGAGKKIEAWAKAVTVITNEPAKIIAGVKQAWPASSDGLDVIARELQSLIASGVAADDVQAALSQEALDFAAIIKFLMMIIELLKSLGII